jgi:hypothetical protein
MNKFQKLAQLNQDIELLENAGKFQAAEVLQRKFVREAQVENMYNDPALNSQIKQNRYQGYTSPGQPAVTPMANMYNDPALNNEIRQNRYQAYTTPEQPAAAPVANIYDNPSLNNEIKQNKYQGYTTPEQPVATPQGTSGDIETAEKNLYQTTIQQIASLLNTQNPENRTKAQQIYENTVGQFKRLDRKHAFERQFQSIVSRNFPAGPIQ